LSLALFLIGAPTATPAVSPIGEGILLLIIAADGYAAATCKRK
jgi:hypothetical protein